MHDPRGRSAIPTATSDARRPDWWANCGCGCENVEHPGPVGVTIGLGAGRAGGSQQAASDGRSQVRVALQHQGNGASDVWGRHARALTRNEGRPTPWRRSQDELPGSHQIRLRPRGRDLGARTTAGRCEGPLTQVVRIADLRDCRGSTYDLEPIGETFSSVGQRNAQSAHFPATVTIKGLIEGSSDQ